MQISVIIPALNEEAVIAKTIGKVRQHSDPSRLKEIIVVDGGSTDATVAQAERAGAIIVKSPKGRAKQMNVGAKAASGEILYFLHADSIPPAGFGQAILKAIDEGYSAGCFRLKFDKEHMLLNFYAWFTRYDVDAFRFGDQSLYMNRVVFSRIGGFREDHIVMEDNEIVRRVKQAYKFCIRPERVTTSARKYREVGVLKLQLIFCLIYIGYFVGASQATLVSWYNKII